MQPMKELVALLFMDLEMAGRVKRDCRGARAPGPDPQRDLLCHRPTGQEHGCLFSQQLGDVALEVGDEAALPVAVGLLVRPGFSRQLGQDRAGPLRPVAEQEAFTLALGDLLQGRYAIESVTMRSKPTFSKPAPDEIVEELIQGADVIVTGVGD